MYPIQDITIPQEKRKVINKKILYLIDHQIEDSGISKEDIFNCYSGIGSLHGLDFAQFENYHEYKEEKKGFEIGQFFTPFILSKFLSNIMQPSDQDLIGDLTAGHGSLINWLPNPKHVYVNEYEVKAYKVLKYLFPKVNQFNEDIRNFQPHVLFDTVLGNPPFNLKWMTDQGKMWSQLYYMFKAHDLLKPGGLLALIVPAAFLSDSFTDAGNIEQVNERFNFVQTLQLPKNLFKQVGVQNFKTKIMIFQKRSEHISHVPFDLNKEIICTDFSDVFAEQLHQEIIQPVLFQKELIKKKLILESKKMNAEDRKFHDQVAKMLFDIKQGKKTKQHYAKAENIVYQYKTQERPSNITYDEWKKFEISQPDVINELKQILKNQHKKEVEQIRLVKTNYGLKLKAYSEKKEHLLSLMKQTKEISFNDMILENHYPFEDQTYKKLFNQKLQQFEHHNQHFKDIQPHKEVRDWLDHLVIKDQENDQDIRLNKIQTEDTAKKLMKPYGYLQWGTGSGKSLSAIAQMLYRKQMNHIRNIFLVAPAIAIHDNWNDILQSYGFDYIMLEKRRDIKKIKPGQLIICTFDMCIKFQKEIKKHIRNNSQKMMLVLDEADSICNPSSKRTKAVLNCFRRLKYKLLVSATSTRNDISEAYTALELLYNNSINMLCKAEGIFIQHKKTKEIVSKTNPDVMNPFPAYKKGHTLFKRCFSPEKVTVFGVGKQSQDIYNQSHLKELNDKTFITRTFEEVRGEKLYSIIQDACHFNQAEKDLYRIIIEEFNRLSYLFKSTGNHRKDALLKIINQLRSLLKACVIPTSFPEYQSSQMPSKAVQMIKLLQDWEHERVAIGCTHIKTVKSYRSYIEKAFPDREVFEITGENLTRNKRKQVKEQLKQTKNGILICTQQSLSSSMNIDFVNKILMLELRWNFPSMHQYFARFIRYTSTEKKEVHFLTQMNSIESNLLQLILAKEKLNSFMKNDIIDDEEIIDRFGIDFSLLDMLMSKELDQDGKSYIRWGSQNIS